MVSFLRFALAIISDCMLGILKLDLLTVSKKKDVPCDANYFKLIIIIQTMIKSACYSPKDSYLK